MKHLLLTIAAVVLVGCGESQQLAPAPEAPTGKASDISIHDAVEKGNIEAVKQHIAAGTDVNAKDEDGGTPLHYAVFEGHKEIAELLIDNDADVNVKDDNKGFTPFYISIGMGQKEISELLLANGADVNAKWNEGGTPLDNATHPDNPNASPEIVDLLRKHGGKTGEELKAEGK